MCYNPYKGFKIGYTDKGKDKYLLTSRDVQVIVRRGYDFYPSYDESLIGKPGIISDYTLIPCGKCYACRMRYAKQWADRCMLELQDHDPDKCWFVTLTYDNDHIFKCVEYSTGEIDDRFPGTLMKSHFQSFMKRLRSDLDYNGKDSHVRYYAAGEYGDKSFRPHYHAIVYNLELNDLSLWEMSKTGFPLFRSPYLEKLWKNGIVVVSQVTWETCSYTARYVLKKTKNVNKDYFEMNDLEPEFVLMSRKPGIGKSYFEKNYEKIYEFDEIILNNGKKTKPPKYFDDLFEAADKSAYDDIKRKRKEYAEWREALTMKTTNLSREEYLKLEKYIWEQKVKKLPRKEI